MVVEIHIEGDKRLQQGFSNLLQQSGKRNFKVLMGNSDTDTAKKFLNPDIDHKLLLTDMDGSAEERPKRMKYLKVENHDNKVHFMVQNMEAWFLSQPEVIKMQFGLDVNKHIKRKAHEIPKPDEFLKSLVSEKREYHKIKDALPMLKNLNLKLLSQNFTDVNNLITELSKS